MMGPSASHKPVLRGTKDSRSTTMKMVLFLILITISLLVAEKHLMTVHTKGELVHYDVKSVDSVTFTAIDTSMDAENATLLALVNKVRSEGCNCGSDSMPPVDSVLWDFSLAQAALSHSEDMNTNNFLSHESSDGSDLPARLARVGYLWSAISENVSKGYATPQEALNGWLASEGHCKNIMNGNFLHMGSGRDGVYWTEVFGKPK